MSLSRCEDVRRAIVEDPFDDAPRRAWSDLLTLGVDGADSPLHAEMGEFVRLQLTMPKLTPVDGRGHLPSSGMERRFPRRAKQRRQDMRPCQCKWCWGRIREDALYPLADDYFSRDGDAEMILWPTREYTAPADGEDVAPPWICLRGLPMAIFECLVDDFVNGCGEAFLRWPIIHVELHPTMTNPARMPNDGAAEPGLWYWFSEGDGMVGVVPPAETCILPACLFDELDDAPAHSFKAYDGALAALEDLSRDCFRLGRRKAGLPELPANHHAGINLFWDSPDALTGGDNPLWP